MLDLLYLDPPWLWVIAQRNNSAQKFLNIAALFQAANNRGRWQSLGRRCQDILKFDLKKKILEIKEEIFL